MKPKIVYIERKPTASVSIERVFRQVARDLSDEFDVEFQQVPYGYGVAAIIKNLLFFRPRPADIYHVTGDVHYVALRLPRNKTVLTVHDLVFLRGRSGFRRWLLKKLFLTAPAKRVAKVTTISGSTQAELAREMPELDGRIHVITNPLFDGFRAEPEKPFDRAKPVILQIGTAPNKNLETLVIALRGLSCHLRIIGDPSKEAKQSLAVGGTEYSVAIGLDERAIVEEYRNADIVTFCSTYEGFGLPIIEAQAMRKPVITSNIPPMSDVAGEGAVLVDPLDAAAIRSAIIKLCEAAGDRQKLVDAGLRNLERFESANVANHYARLYERAIAGSVPEPSDLGY